MENVISISLLFFQSILYSFEIGSYYLIQFYFFLKSKAWRIFLLLKLFLHLRLSYLFSCNFEEKSVILTSPSFVCVFFSEALLLSVSALLEIGSNDNDSEKSFLSSSLFLLFWDRVKINDSNKSFFLSSLFLCMLFLKSGQKIIDSKKSFFLLSLFLYLLSWNRVKKSMILIWLSFVRLSPQFSSLAASPVVEH